MINGHGNNIADYNGKVKYDFSSNVINNGHLSSITEHIAQHIGNIGNYPDANYFALRLKIAKHHALSVSNVWPVNGSTEAFYMVARKFYNKQSCIIVPGFSEYEDACRSHGHTICFISSPEDLSGIDAPDVLWIGNPNNPDGKQYSRTQLIMLLETYPQTQLVVDEAYCELCEKPNSIVDLVNTYKNLIVIKSLTKLFAIPGIRLGYIVACQETISVLMQGSMPWSVNVPAMQTGMFIMDHFSSLLPNVASILCTAKRIQDALEQDNRFELIRSETTFFLLKLLRETASVFQMRLLNDYGILVRDASNFRGLNMQYVRIGVRDEASDKILLHALLPAHVIC